MTKKTKQNKKTTLARIHMIVYTEIQIAYWITELNHLYALTVIWSFFFLFKYLISHTNTLSNIEMA